MLANWASADLKFCEKAVSLRVCKSGPSFCRGRTAVLLLRIASHRQRLQPEQDSQHTDEPQSH